MKILLLSSTAAVLAFSLSANANARDVVANSSEDEVVIADLRVTTDILVTASRDFNVRIAEHSGSATIITSEDIENRQTRDIADVLRDVPGVAVSSIAGQTQLRLRGSEGNHVLVLVDGIEVSDPFAGEFDVGTLQAEIGSSLEVLRGPQSALYGSDAIGGVIAYNSASGADRQGFSARIEGGSHGTLNASARIGIGDTDRNLALNATLVSTDGTPNAIGGTRDIGRDSYTLSGKGEIAASHNLTFRGSARFIRTDGDFNDQDFDATSPTLGLVIDTPGVSYENEAFYALVGARLETMDGDWTHDLSGQIADITRDTFAPNGRTSGSKGERLKASYVSSFRFDDAHSLTFAADIEREEFRNRDPFGFAFTGSRSARNIGLVGEYRYDGEAFDLSAAIRHDFSNRFADETTFKVGVGYFLTEATRVRASAGTGIKNPGFFELYGFFDGTFIGNPNLQPEKSFEWEVGADQYFADGDIRLSATYFDAELENEIFTSFPAPDFIATPANRDSDSTRRGIELSVQANLDEQFSLNATYTYLDAEENGVTEVRRPENTASASLNWQAPSGNATANLTVRHNGSALDSAFTDPSFVPETVVLDDYTLVNFYGEFRISDGIRAFGRVENLLDEEYSQVFSFISQGRSAIIGISASF